MSEPVRYDVDDAVCTITLHRPDVRNAVDGPTAAALLAAFERFEADDDVAVAVHHAADGLGEEPSWVGPALQGGAVVWTLTTVALGVVVVAAHRRRRAVDRTGLGRPGTMGS